MENWVVTAGSTNFYDNLLTSFVASLRETAGWTGNIGIMNYGLTPHQVWTLRNNGIEVLAPMMKYKALIDDRFTTVGNYFKDRQAIIAEWDIDIWFCGSITDVFDKVKPSSLMATYDCTHQGFMTSCVNPAMHKTVAQAVERVKAKTKNVLQGGFIAGDSQAWYTFSGYQDTIIGLEVGYDVFGIDMIALNLFKYFFPDRLDVVGVEWNCLPEWTIRKEGDKFYCSETEEPLRAIHVSSPNRKGPYLYQTHYPEEFEKWSKLLT